LLNIRFIDLLIYLLIFRSFNFPFIQMPQASIVPPILPLFKESERISFQSKLNMPILK